MNAALFSDLDEWIRAVLPSLTAVIRSNPKQADAPRPDFPYAAIQMRTDLAQGSTAHVHTSDEEGEAATKVKQYHSWPRRGTIVIDLFGDGSSDMIASLQLSVNWPRVQQILRASKIAIRYAGGLGDTTELRSTAYEPSAQAEFFVDRTQAAIEEIDAIETAEVTVITGS